MAEREKESEVEKEVVTGNIGLLGLGEIIQTIDHNHRTIRMTLSHAGETATVYTDKGRVIGALVNDLDGLEALYKAFGWIEADFSYEHSESGAISKSDKRQHAQPCDGRAGAEY